MSDEVARVTSGPPRAGAARPARPFPLRIPLYGYAGALLNALAWGSAWARVGPWPYVFFPLWLGFILALDGINVARTGTSPWRQGRWQFVGLFLYSMLFWWTFEALNAPVGNWHYRWDHAYTPLGMALVETVAFSTVLPAVTEMAALVGSAPWLARRPAPRRLGHRLGARVLLPVALVLSGFGVALIVLAVAFPHWAFGGVWLCLIFLLDPINNRAGRPSALGHLLSGDWRFFVTWPLAGLCTGFFWEMWNSRALPNWYYTVPLVDGAPHLFAMPLPGYLGYLPFGVELFVMYQFARLVTDGVARVGRSSPPAPRSAERGEPGR
ncbi:MAG TPA: hypothetical protein VGR57_13895 [Ktedonobacterales bacterium]|nr:hypothetical protein [Ktedonobacterales bacterium]